MFQHEVRKIVGCERVVGTYRQGLLVRILRFLPLIPGFQQAAKRNVNSHVIRICRYGAVIGFNRLVHRAPRNLGARQHQERVHIIWIQFGRFLKRRFRFGGVLVAHLELAEKNVQRAICRNFRHLLLKNAQRLGVIPFLQRDIDEACDGLNIRRIAFERLAVQLLGFVKFLLAQA